MCAFDKTTTEQPEPSTYAKVQLQQVRKDVLQPELIDDLVISEVPVALVYNGISHVVLMCTPNNLYQLALGFSLTEGILTSVNQLYDWQIINHPHGVEVQMQIAAGAFALLKQRRRAIEGRTGCGICGIDSLQQLQRDFKPVPQQLQLNAKLLFNVLEQIDTQQVLHSQTGSSHSAAWFNQQAQLINIFEDVGRHNALDKLLGWGAANDINWSQGFISISSRASYEMVQKAASLGVEMLVAVSAPTELAINCAKTAQMTLIGWNRKHKHSIYSAPQRLAYPA